MTRLENRNTLDSRGNMGVKEKYLDQILHKYAWFLYVINGSNSGNSANPDSQFLWQLQFNKY